MFDSVSVATTFKAKLGEMGIIFCSISEAIQEHPEMVRQYLGSVVPTCPTRTNWQKINDAIHRALDEVSLADMMGPMAAFIPSFERRTQQTREL